MKNQPKINTLSIISYAVIFMLTLTVFAFHAVKGMHISSFWRQGSEQITINPGMVNGVEFGFLNCPKFMDEKTGTRISVSIQNKDLLAQKAGVILLISKQGLSFEQTVENEYVKLNPGERMSFSWEVDQSNVVGGKASVRLFLGKSPYHPVHSVRSCVILPWRGPLPVGFMNTFAYPILILLVLAGAAWLYFKSGLDWQNKKRLFFFVFANIVLVLMFISLLLRLYMLAILALPFLILGVIATMQKSPYLNAEEYSDFISHGTKKG